MRIPAFLCLLPSLVLLQACDDSGTAAATDTAGSNVDAALIGRWISVSPSDPLTMRDTANIATERIHTPYFSWVGGSFTARDGHIGYKGNYSEDYEVSGDTLWLEFVLSSESDAKVERSSRSVLKFVRR